ncbi:MAG: DUF6549 family protein [Bacteroides xylanisolvens]
MKINLNKVLLLLALGLGVATYTLYNWGSRMKEERDTYQSNTRALLADVTQVRIDSAMMASTVQVLSLSLDEYKKYRAEDAATIKKLGVRIKDLKTVGRHDVEINVPIDVPVKDTAVIKDTVKIIVKTVKMDTPYIKLNGIIEDNHLKGNIHLPVHLHQVFGVEYKHRFLWWRWKVKAIHQTISSDNPYVEIKYTEFINLRK